VNKIIVRYLDVGVNVDFVEKVAFYCKKILALFIGFTTVGF